MSFVRTLYFYVGDDKNMGLLIEQLYGDMFRDREPKQPFEERKEDAYRAWSTYEHELLSLLPDETKTKVLTLDEKQTYYASFEMVEEFIRGFKMGALLAIEIHQ